MNESSTAVARVPPANGLKHTSRNSFSKMKNLPHSIHNSGPIIFALTPIFNQL
jgi:hypothetical protein